MVGRMTAELDNGMVALRSGDKVTICSDGNISLRKEAFEACYFHSIHFQGIHTSHMKNMSCLFAQSQIDEIDFQGFDTSDAENMSYMFFVSRIVKMNLSSFDTTHVQSMRSMFEGCQIPELDLKHFCFQAASDIRDLFRLCAADKINLSGAVVPYTLSRKGLFEKVSATAQLLTQDPVLKYE